MEVLRRAGSASPNTSGRLRLSSVSIPLTSTPTDGGTLFLLACRFIGALPVWCSDDMIVASTSETEIIESHRFCFLVYGAMACPLRRPGAHQRYADTGPPPTPTPHGRLWREAGVR